jgi:hypothetical protein
MCAWDASAAVPPDAWEDADRPPVALPDADAEKWAGRVQGVPVRDAQQSELPVARALPDAAAELYTPAADRSAARSCAVREDQASLASPAQPDAAQCAMSMLKLAVQPARVTMRLPRLEARRPDELERSSAAQASQPPVDRPQEQRPRDALPAE